MNPEGVGAHSCIWFKSSLILEQLDLLDESSTWGRFPGMNLGAEDGQTPCESEF